MDVFAIEKARNNFELCKKIALIVKKMISFDIMTTILMNFISQANHASFFGCLKYLPENESIEFDFDSLFQTSLKFNNVWEIEDQKVIFAITMNIRIVFCRDYLFSTTLNEFQIEELNSSIFMNNSYILKHLIDIMPVRFWKIGELFEKCPRVMRDFFTELISLFKGTSDILKSKFARDFVQHGFLKQVAEILLRQYTLPDPDKQIIQLCFEVLAFLTACLPITLTEILKTRCENTEQTFLKRIPLFFDSNDRGVTKYLLELFEIPYMTPVTQEYFDMLGMSVLPSLLEASRIIDCSNATDSQFKFCDFVVKLHLSHFKTKRPDLVSGLIKNNILKEITTIKQFKQTKFSELTFLQYLSHLLAYWKSSDEFTNYELEMEPVFDTFLEIHDRHCQRKRNLLFSIVQSIMKTVAESSLEVITDSFIKSTKKIKTSILSDNIFLKMNRDVRGGEAMHYSETIEQASSVTSKEIQPKIAQVSNPVLGVVVREFSFDNLDLFHKKPSEVGILKPNQTEETKKATSKIEIQNILKNLTQKNNAKSKFDGAIRLSIDLPKISRPAFEQNMDNLLVKRESM